MPRFRVPKALKDRLHRGQGYVPSQREFVNELIALAGGPGALAKVIWTEINSPKAPPSVRARALEIILRSMKAVEREQRAPEPTDLTDEELNEFIDERLARLAEAAEGEGANGGS